jgi:hypothetical protein
MQELGTRDAAVVTAQVRTAFGANGERFLANGGSCPAIAGAAAAVKTLRARGHNVGIATGG